MAFFFTIYKAVYWKYVQLCENITTVTAGVDPTKEYSLHSQVKAICALPGDRLEARLGDYVVDILRGEMAIEVQTQNFSALRRKLQVLTADRPVRLVYPLPERKWITHFTRGNVFLKRRRSPKRGKLTDVFRELVMIPDMIGKENFSLEILFIDEEEERCADGRGSWRRRGVSIRERRLLRVNGRILFQGREDYLRFLPEGLGRAFTNSELASAANIPVWTARQITYCLRRGGIVQVAGEKGRAFVFQRA